MQLAAEQTDVPVLAESVAAQQLAENVRVERAGLVTEPRIGLDLLANHGVGQRHSQVGRRPIEQHALDHAVEDGIRQAQRARLLGLDRAAERLSEPPHGVAILLLERRGGDLDPADFGSPVGAASRPEHVGDAPNAEAQHQEQEQDLDDQRSRALANGFQHDGFDVPETLTRARPPGDGTTRRMIEAGRHRPQGELAMQVSR